MKPKKLSAAKLKKRYTLDEARSIPGPFVYGLHNGLHVFYIGKTIDAYGRFTAHKNRIKKTPIELLRAMRDAGASLRVVILEHNPPNLVEAEKAYIAFHADNLVNRAACTGRMRARFSEDRLCAAALATELVSCPHCGGENVADGKHNCRSEVSILTPRANERMQNLLRASGFLRPTPH